MAFSLAGSGEHAASCIYRLTWLLPLPPGGDSNAHLFAQSRTLRVRQGHSLNCSTVGSTSPLSPVPHCASALNDFHEVSRAEGPKWQGRKIQGLDEGR